MKIKGTALVVAALGLLTLAACSKGSGTSATALIKKGDTALTNANYSGAKAYYDAANATKANKTAKAAKAAAGDFIAAESARQKHDYSLALDKVKAAKGANATVKTTKHKLQEAITKERTAYTKLFDAYQAAAAKQDTDTNGSLTATNSVLNEDSLLKPAFRDLRIKVLLLQSQLKTTLATTATSSKPATTTKANDSESNENTTNDADTGITAADITKARQQLKDQGVDASAWSDNDIKAAIKNARAAGRDTVKESDMENYQ
jgi:hypothetical protein